ncbi:MAG TPA: ion channel [Rhodopila sp.]|jgi:inward rectifier potassium channel|nr:ion channel [Rhodopila sp.]
MQKPIPVGREEFGLWKLGVQRFDLRDPYHLAISLPWFGFVAVMIGIWLAINVIFALLYVISPGDIANARPGSFGDVFFFSIETLATVGYGVMAPASLYGHIVSAAEIVAGTAFTAIVTGLLFVRFSRPKAKILYADDAVVTRRNGTPTLMLRLANARISLLTGTNVRLFVLLAERTTEGAIFRRVRDLPLLQSHLPIFAMPWTLIHVIDQSSPLHGYDADTLAASDARIIVTVEARDQALAATVQDVKSYTPAHVRFGMHFADAVMQDERGNSTADLSRISLLESDSFSS